MPEPPEASERAEDLSAPVQNGGRAAPVLLAALLLASIGGAVFAACALWQAGAVAYTLLEMTERTRASSPRTATSSPAALVPSAGPPDAHAVAPEPAALAAAPALPKASRVPDTLLATLPPNAEPRASRRFEEQAEASEKSVPLGLEATLIEADELLVLGEPPPAGFPHTRCEDIFVYIVTIAEGAPLRSAASLGFGKKGPARLRRPGQRIGKWTVLAISDDWSGLNPDVWLEKQGQVCRAELAGNPDRVHVAPKPPPPKKAPARRKKRRKR